MTRPVLSLPSDRKLKLARLTEWLESAHAHQERRNHNTIWQGSFGRCRSTIQIEAWKCSWAADPVNTTDLFDPIKVTAKCFFHSNPHAFRSSTQSSEHIILRRDQISYPLSVRRPQKESCVIKGKSKQHTQWHACLSRIGSELRPLIRCFQVKLPRKLLRVKTNIKIIITMSLFL